MTPQDLLTAKLLAIELIGKAIEVKVQHRFWMRPVSAQSARQDCLFEISVETENGEPT